MSTSRSDGRSNNEMRQPNAELSLLDRADGSAKFGFGAHSAFPRRIRLTSGGTPALASVSGPIEVRLREELPDKATFEVLHRPLEGIAGELADFYLKD